MVSISIVLITTIFFSITGITVNGKDITHTDINSSEGVIHIVDEFLRNWNCYQKVYVVFKYTMLSFNNHLPLTKIHNINFNISRDLIFGSFILSFNTWLLHLLLIFWKSYLIYSIINKRNVVFDQTSLVNKKFFI